MSDLAFRAQPAKIALTAATLKTLVQLLAPTNQRLRITEISISFDGVSNTATPVYVEVVRQTSAGTLTNATTLRKDDPALPETLQTTCRDTATIEPTDSGDVPVAELVHPQTGFLWQAGFGRELKVPGAGRLGIRCTAAAGVNASVRICAEE